jgi:electron transfer flavoprotein beta subunit
MPLPCVVAAGKGLNTPRYPTFPDIVKSRKKPVDTIAMEDLPIETPAGGVEVVRYESAAEPRHPKVLTGPAQSIAAQLVAILRDEARVL